MSVLGTWNLIVKGPTGPMATTLTLDEVDGALVGTQSGQGNSSAIVDAKLDGNTISWINRVNKPMQMKLEFSGQVDGKVMTGKVKAGFMGSYPFEASME
jgi:hypothetical protein